jgi:hypothetical protein
MRHQQQAKSSKQKISYGCVYQINLSGKIYIGNTITSLKKRIYNHVYQAVKGSKYSKWEDAIEVPFMKPYQNYQGKNSSIMRLLNNSTQKEKLKALPDKGMRKWLVKEVLKRTKTLRTVEYKLTGDHKRNKAQAKSILEDFELLYIKREWVKVPTKLLNYNGLPIHRNIPQRLRKAYLEDIEKSKLIKFDNDNGFYLTELGKIKAETLALKLRDALEVVILSDLIKIIVKEEEEEEALQCSALDSILQIIVKGELARIKKSRRSRLNVEKTKQSKRLKGICDGSRSSRAEAIVKDTKDIDELYELDEDRDF